MNTQPFFITAEQRQTLQNILDAGDRTRFYVELHNMTGSQAALDMAEISSRSDLRGGVAWLVNDAYSATVPGYPEEGVAHFSEQIARADFDSFDFDGPTQMWRVPSDIDRYRNARETWNRIGTNNGNPTLGNDYFPGNWLIAQHYLEQGDLDTAWNYVTPETMATFLFGAGARGVGGIH